jgi:hypothetical protein
VPVVHCLGVALEQLLAQKVAKVPEPTSQGEEDDSLEQGYHHLEHLLGLQAELPALEEPSRVDRAPEALVQQTVAFWVF